MLLLQTVKNLGKATMAVGKEVVHRHFKALLPGLELAQQLLLVAADHFCRRGGRRGAQVGDKIGDSDVSLMAYGADDGNRLAKIARATRSSLKLHKSSSEPPPRPTISTSHSWARVGQLNRANDLPRRIFSLDGGRVNNHRQGRIAALEHV